MATAEECLDPVLFDLADGKGNRVEACGMGLAGIGMSFAVQAALGNDPRSHIKPLGIGGIAFWALFTVIWVVQVIRFRSFWGASPSFASFSAQARSIQLSFRRQA